MVLASTTETTSIDELAKLPDKITEFAMPTSSISAVSQSQLSSEMEHLFKVGKHLSQQLVVATGAAGHQQPSRLFYVTDRSTRLQFLVDTGAEVSIVPPTPTDHLHQWTGLSLQVVTTLQ